MNTKTQQPWQQSEIILHSQLLCQSFQHWTGEALIDIVDNPLTLAEKLFFAPFVVVSHGMESDPVFNYGNQMALKLWQMNWQDFTNLPSRLSAEPIEQSERERMLKQSLDQGLINNYRGVRISSQGDRFLIEDGIIWTLSDEQNQPCGQAAMFMHWTPIVE
jgi:MEKHLA domain